MSAFGLPRCPPAAAASAPAANAAVTNRPAANAAPPEFVWRIRPRMTLAGRDRPVVPVLVGYAVLDSPHVEPCGGVGFARRSRIGKLAHDGDNHTIGFGGDRDDLRLPAVAVGNRPGRPPGEELHHRV